MSAVPPVIESADWLCQKHFGKSLIDPGVEILDPATGTGTFVCELLEHFRGQRQKWLLMRFSGEDTDIDLNAHEHAEFEAWRWVEPEQVPELIVPFKRPVYERVVKEFTQQVAIFAVCVHLPSDLRAEF